MTLQFLLYLSVILFLGSVLQGAVGFAFSLFVIPMLAWADLSLTGLVAIVAATVSVQVVVSTLQLRADVCWRDVLPATFIRYVTLPLGIALLLAMESLDKTQMRQVLGGLVLAALLLQLVGHIEPREQLHRGWMLLAFGSSGIMQGLAAMGGPPAVLWVMAHGWNSRRSRAFLLALFSTGMPIQLALLYLSAEQDLSGPILTGLAFAPVVIAGSMAGVWLGNHLEKTRLRQVAFAILLASALASVAAPLFG